jgi:sugar (pentulose or hexulose) kinase
MQQKVTAVFDIGRTNKKFFLFDDDLKEVYREYIRFDEIVDEDGYPSDDLQAIEKWSKEVFERMMKDPKYLIESLNFSCYGATLVHIDENGKVVTPLYNYLKPLDNELSTSFFNKYGPEEEITKVTGSLNLGMLNTGLQMYWLKYAKPSVFKKIKYTLHLPQYLSYIFTGIPVGEFTSIGCHTMLWDYEKKEYHKWVYQENIDKKLPPIGTASTILNIDYNGSPLKIGVGIHDSSSALLPYLRSIKKPFLLVSTGTWSISINPFTQGLLTTQDIKDECLFNMRIDGNPVKASRLLLGSEYKYQVTKLSEHYRVPYEQHETVKFNSKTFHNLSKNFDYCFCWQGLPDTHMPKKTTLPHATYEEAYHQLFY